MGNKRVRVEERCGEDLCQGDVTTGDTVKKAIAAACREVADCLAAHGCTALAAEWNEAADLLDP